MTLDEALAVATATDDPLGSLRAHVIAELDAGATRAEVYDTYLRLALDLRAAGREADEDLVLELLDLLVGWASPHVVIPRQPGERSPAEGSRVDVVLHLHPTDAGGRRKPVLAGHRAPWWLGRPAPGGSRSLNDAEVETIEGGVVAPGGEAAATLVPREPILWPQLGAGDVIELHDGARAVGTATVVAVRPPS